MMQVVSEISPADSGQISTGSSMIWAMGGTFRMGSDLEEAPVRRVSVDPFGMDRTPVTNRQFRDFVRATGNATVAEGNRMRGTVRNACDTRTMPARSLLRRPTIRQTEPINRRF
jgi:formylglycine-generating enzyme required for sulfatase activity